MYEIIKKINDNTFLALKENSVFVLKRTDPSEIELYDRLGRINHKNVVGFHGSTAIENNLYAVFEYISGETLEEYVKRKGILTDSETKNIASQVCDGLASVHEAGIVHRDIKPGNIIITKSGDPVIIDFGISRLIKENVSFDTYLLGTQGYAAPEQFGFNQSTNKTDIYAMGVLINFMKTGCLPAEKKLEGALRETVEKCIQIDEDKRYASADELKRALQRKRMDLKLVKKMLYSVPGLKRDNTAVTAVSAIYYILAFIFISYATENKGIRGFLSDRIPMFFMFVMPYFIMWDIGSFTSKLGVSKEKNKVANLIFKIAVSVISVAVGFIFIAVFPPDK